MAARNSPVKSAQYQIVGGGLIGLATAYALLLRGAKNVRVIEAREAVGLETSYANAGMVHASLANPWNGPEVGGQLLRSLLGQSAAMRLRPSALPSLLGWGRKFLRYSSGGHHWHATRHNYLLAEYSIGLNREWRDELSIDDGYDGDGLLKIFRTQEDLETAKDSAAKLHEFGLDTAYFTTAQAIEKEPALASIAGQFEGGIYYPTDFKADAHAFCQALEKAVINLGGEVIVETSVAKFMQNNGKIVGVETNTGPVLADTTIICAGAQSQELLKPLGINLGLRPVKGYSLSFPKELVTDGGVYPKIPVVDDSLHGAITPFDGFIRIAGTAELAGYNRSMSAKDLSPLLGMLKQVFPHISQNLSLENAKAWHGFRPVSADGLPIIGKTSMAGLAVNTGHAHMGWTLCAGSGALLADVLLGEPLKVSAEVFSPQR